MPSKTSSLPASSVEYRWGTVAEIRQQISTEYAVKQWEEAGIDKELVPLDIDYEKYDTLEKVGVYKAMIAWADGTIVAYAGFIFGPNIHHRSTPHALNLGIYVSPIYRGIGPRVVRAAERGFAQMVSPKVIRIIYEAPAGSRWRKTLHHLGYTEFGTVHQKVVRNGTIA